MSIVEFLLARIEENEAVARPLLDHLNQEHNEGLFQFEDCHNGPILCVDPRRALSEAQAKRQILERHQPTEVWTEATMPLMEGDVLDPEAMGRALAGGEKPWGWEDRTIKGEDGQPVVFLDPVETKCTHDIRFAPWPCPDVLILASVYSDHPDFREEWRASS